MGRAAVFLKASDLSAHTAEDLDRVSTEMNQRPRRVLDWKTPEQLVLDYLSISQIGSPLGLPRDEDLAVA